MLREVALIGARLFIHVEEKCVLKLQRRLISYLSAVDIFLGTSWAVFTQHNNGAAHWSQATLASAEALEGKNSLFSLIISWEEVIELKTWAALIERNRVDWRIIIKRLQGK